MTAPNTAVSPAPVSSGVLPPDTLRLPVATTFDEAATLAAALAPALAAAGPVWRIDASAVQACDSSTIALLLQARRLAQVAGKPIELVGVPAKLVELSRLYGVDGLLPAVAAAPVGTGLSGADHASATARPGTAPA